nr:MAG TPA: hypothetical protein [Caudoviricetes sp.]
MRSIDALVPQETNDTSKKIIINENVTTDAIGELNVNLKEMTDSTKESIEKITTDFQNTIKKMFEKETTQTPTETTPKGDNE